MPFSQMIEKTRVIIIKAVHIQTQHRDESKLILNEHQGENPKSSDQQYVDLILYYAWKTIFFKKIF